MKIYNILKILFFSLILFSAAAMNFAQTCVPASTAAGAFDTCFDGDGKVTTDVSPDPDFARAVVVQPDGKIVVAGNAGDISASATIDFAVVRYNANGSLDTTFDGDGKVVTDFGADTADNDDVTEVALQTDGKIVVAGSTKIGSDIGIALVRYNADGSLDTSFDGDGRAQLRLNTILIYVYDMAILPDGKILVAGGLFSGDNFFSFVARFNSNGSLDGSFDGDGYNCCTIQGASAMALQDDKILIAGTIQDYSTLALARFNSDGSRDTFFGTGGVATYPGQSLSALDMGVRFDDSIITSGWNRVSDTELYGALIRFNTDGTFAASRIYNTDYAFWAMTFQTDGKILTAGQSLTPPSGFTIRRFTDVNVPDTTFNGGAVHVKFLPDATPEGSSVRDIATTRDHKIVAAGAVRDTSASPTPAKFAVAKLMTGINPPDAVPFDFDGDRKADISVYRASQMRWYILRSSDFGVTEKNYRAIVPAPADYDGDGKTDVSNFVPQENRWWYLSSVMPDLEIPWAWGTTGDIPLPSDFDGDGKSDYIVYRPSQNFWYRINPYGITSFGQFGIAGDKPLIGDFDGDGKSEKAIYRPASGDWWWQSSSDKSLHATHWGISTDVPTPADYDGDDKTDLAVYRPSNGTWYIYNSATNSPTVINFGLSTDKPVAADYDGDGKADIAVFRPSTGVWYLLRSTQGFTALQFGISTDIPVPNVFIQQ